MTDPYLEIEPELRDLETGRPRSLGPFTRRASVPARAELTSDKSDLLWWPFDRSTGRQIRFRRDLKPDGTLNEFLRIKDARGVLGFARRRGVLGLCEHGIPATHRPRPPFFGVPDEALEGAPSWCEPTGYLQTPGHERIERWLDYVGQMTAAARLGTRLRRGELGDDADWATLRVTLEHGATSVRDRRFGLMVVINNWLHIADVRPVLQLAPGAGVAMASETYGILVWQVAGLFLNGGAWAFCSGCSQFYERPGPRAPTTQNNYCTDCRRTGVDARNRQERAREKRREAGDGKARER